MTVRHPKSTALRTRSEKWLARAKQSVAGGDSSTMRVLPYHPPFVVDRGEGCRIWDVDDNEYIDLNMAYGPLLFGHRPPFLVESVTRQISDKGSQLGFPQELNFLVAEKIKRLFPSIALLRFANSGTEAIASSIRLARVFTGRPNIILFEGHYHGWSDAAFHKYHASLEELGTGALRRAIPGTNGMSGSPHDAFVVEWNDVDALKRTLDELSGSVAAVVMEPVMGNAGVIAPRDGYLAAVRDLTRNNGALLIFDEVISGLRVAAGGAQELYSVQPDITILSKAIGGGVPIAAFGSSVEIMDVIVRGELFHGGVYSNNAMVMSAANAVLTYVLANQSEIYRELYARSEQLANGFRTVLTRHGVPHVMQSIGPMLSCVLTLGPIKGDIQSYREIRAHADLASYIALQHALLDRGVYIHPNQFEPMYLSTTHRKEDIDEVTDRFDDAARECFT